MRYLHQGRGLTGALENGSPAHWIENSPAHWVNDSPAHREQSLYTRKHMISFKITCKQERDSPAHRIQCGRVGGVWGGVEWGGVGWGGVGCDNVVTR